MTVLPRGAFAFAAGTATKVTADHSGIIAALIVALATVIAAIGAPLALDHIRRRHTRTDKQEMALSAQTKELYEQMLRHRDEDLAYKDKAIHERDERIAGLIAENDRMRRRR